MKQYHNVTNTERIKINNRIISCMVVHFLNTFGKKTSIIKS